MSGGLGACLAVNVALAHFDLPDYGTWTGIRPLEFKLHLLEGFEQRGSVDAVVLGSSIADTGFSATLYSELMSRDLGRPYRAFNLATGGAEVASLPNLYRLMRTVSTPHSVLLVLPAGVKRADGVSEHMPDFVLERAPVHRTLSSQWLLDLDRIVHDVPVIRYASPIREELLYGRYASLRAQGVEIFGVSENGDRLTYTHEANAADLARVRAAAEADLGPGVSDAGQASPADQMQRYFNMSDIQAADELRTIAAADGVEIVLVAHASAATLERAPPQDRHYRAARREYFEALSQELGARLIYALDDFWVPSYAVGDTTHLNHFGAVLFTERVVREMVGPGAAGQGTSVPMDARTPDLGLIDSGGPSFTPYTGVVLRDDSSAGSTLELRFVERDIVPPPPPGQYSIALRLPDGSDQISPARRIGSAVFQATFPGLPTSTPEVLLARLVRQNAAGIVAVNHPIDGYSWTGQ